MSVIFEILMDKLFDRWTRDGRYREVRTSYEEALKAPSDDRASIFHDSLLQREVRLEPDLMGHFLAALHDGVSARRACEVMG